MTCLFNRRKSRLNKLVILIVACLLVVVFLYIHLSLQINEQTLESQPVINKENDKDIEMRQMFHATNSKADIRNKHFINDLLKLEEPRTQQYKAPKFFVILVQVHSRVNYLKELIESLRQTKYIEDTLVIFSHDLYLKEMNDLIQGIDFCAVLIY